MHPKPNTFKKYLQTVSYLLREYAKETGSKSVDSVGFLCWFLIKKSHWRQPVFRFYRNAVIHVARYVKDDEIVYFFKKLKKCQAPGELFMELYNEC